MIRTALVYLALGLFSFLSWAKETKVSLVQKTESNEIMVLAYNVLNLFDSEHDKNKDDYTFLPLNFPGKKEACEKVSNPYYRKECLTVDWSEAKFFKKIKQIKKVIEAQGSLPDVMVVEEIENEVAAKNLSKALGYSHYLITNSPDERGIDVAMFYQERKLKFLEYEEIKVADVGTKPTRNILRLDFSISSEGEKKRVSVYGNHWPSQAAPSNIRVSVAKVLKADINKQVQAYGKNLYVIAFGDFNVIEKESPNAIDDVIGSESWDNRLIDVQPVSFANNNPYRQVMPIASHYYPTKNKFDRLDRILISKNLMDKEGMDVILKSYRIVSLDFMKEVFEFTDPNSRYYGIKVPNAPIRYDFHGTDEAKLGFSDHFPISVKFTVP